MSQGFSLILPDTIYRQPGSCKKSFLQTLLIGAHPDTSTNCAVCYSCWCSLTCVSRCPVPCNHPAACHYGPSLPAAQYFVWWVCRQPRPYARRAAGSSWSTRL